MGAIATFDPVAWALRYPEFASLSPALATSYFNEAGLYLNNVGASPVQDPNAQTSLMWMLTAHIAKINATVSVTSIVNGQSVTTTSPAAGLVGRISSASEGSVSVSTDLAGVPATGTSAWLAQTPYGLSFIAATRQYVSARYVPRPCQPFGPFAGAIGYRGF